MIMPVILLCNLLRDRRITKLKERVFLLSCRFQNRLEEWASLVQQPLGTPELRMALNAVAVMRQRQKYDRRPNAREFAKAASAAFTGLGFFRTQVRHSCVSDLISQH